MTTLPWQAMTAAMTTFGDAAAKAMATIAAAANNLARALRRVPPEQALYEARARHGGNATDAAYWPDQWISAVCAGWIHESCESFLLDLQCTCSCHQNNTPSTRGGRQ